MTWDFVVVGHGLAGAALAWQLRARGVRVLVVDPDRPATASRVAGGLVSPVAGPRMAAVPRWEDLRREADAFYTEEEFWELYNGTAYAKLKETYDPRGRFLDLYAKCVGNR